MSLGVLDSVEPADITALRGGLASVIDGRAADAQHAIAAGTPLDDAQRDSLVEAIRSAIPGGPSGAGGVSP